MTYTEQDAKAIESSLAHFPHAKVSYSTLGGVERASILINLSLDPQSTWSNGIYQNSRYLQLHLNGGKLSLISTSHRLPKFRKCTIKSVDQVSEKIANWASKV